MILLFYFLTSCNKMSFVKTFLNVSFRFTGFALFMFAFSSFSLKKLNASLS